MTEKNNSIRGLIIEDKCSSFNLQKYKKRK